MRVRERVVSKMMAKFLNWMTGWVKVPFTKTVRKQKEAENLSKEVLFRNSFLMSKVPMGCALGPVVYTGSAVNIRIHLSAVPRRESRLKSLGHHQPTGDS